ncbi:GAF domain-containing protein [Leptolyngbya sp. FACHB-711]|uniref:GAF domain-containing protein n=1 Tax=Leptolyngbya sp. FACHB-711 TaxID=2692813 RepID=UPI0019A1E7F8|nr:GAF domain-containing protein [Leptolyngbya sp. FACHB-711]MBD1853825.1 GAF domain-containing protein [Cyanobacteria bacterium FACHB-502]
MNPNASPLMRFARQIVASSDQDFSAIQNSDTTTAEDTTMRAFERSHEKYQQDYSSRMQPTTSVETKVDEFAIPGGNSLRNEIKTVDLNQAFTIVKQMQQADNLNTLLATTVKEIHQYLQVDRAIVYQFQSENQGIVLAESLTGGYTPTLEETLPAIAFGAAMSQDPQPFMTVDLTSRASLTPHQVQLLDRFQVQASLSLPIWLEDELWGLLVVQQCNRVRQWQDMEILVLRQIATELQLQMQPIEYRDRRQQKARMEPVLAQIIESTNSSSDTYTALANLCEQLRRFYKADRVVVYRFYPEWQGEFVAESVGAGWLSLVDAQADDPSLTSSEIVSHDRCVSKRNGAPAFNDDRDKILEDTQGGSYTRRQQVKRVNDIYSAGFSSCYINTLEKYQAKAYIIAPVFERDSLWGLIAVYQCTAPRVWTDSEVMLLSLLSDRLSTVLRQLESIGRVQEKSAQLESQSQRLAQIVERGVSYSKLTYKLGSALLQENFSIDHILQFVVKEVRQQLGNHRVALYRFNEDWSGEFIIEDADRNCYSIVGAHLKVFGEDSLQTSQGGRYRRRETLCVDDISVNESSDFPVTLLQEWGASAYLAAPIVKEEQLWGLIVAFQNDGPRHWEQIDINLLAQVGVQVGLALQLAESFEQLRGQSMRMAQSAEQGRFILSVVDRIRRSLDLQQVFKTTAREIRNFLEVDRVAIFKFHADSHYTTGETIAEDVRPGYTSALAVQVVDHCFNERYAEEYRKGRVWATADIYQANLQACYIEVLGQFQVRANLVIPLLKGEELWGLFCIHQCSGAREWQETEIEFAKQIAAQLNVAIQQGEYVERLQAQSAQLAEVADREKVAKEQLQQEVIQLLSAVRPALDGDLTVRAPVTDDEVGTIAAAYNNTLGSLRQIVMQMQTAANQVAQTSQDSESSIASLTAQAQEQFQALTQALQRVQQMVSSTQAVETNAQQVEAAVQQANQIVITGDAAMDRTVDEMEGIRETVAETNDRLQRLSESSRKISRVVSLISNFTTQTQLLALNAAIEATRAGEYGRGFAVVADEVRSLARQSANAATEIEQLVQEIQAGTAEVSTAMETGIKRVVSGTEVVNDARENLNAIVDATSQISYLVAGITQATQEQTHQCQSVTQTMTEVAAIANKTSGDAVEIATSFKHLLTMAQDLQSKSEQFKVD